MVLVKVCGIRTPEAAIQAALSGANLIGLIFAKSKRQVTPQEARAIVQAVAERFEPGKELKLPGRQDVPFDPAQPAASWFAHWAQELERQVAATPNHRPLVVGVFSNQSSREINEAAAEAGLDLIQLHGDEPDELCGELILPVIRAVHVGEGETAAGISAKVTPGHYSFILLDSKVTGATQQGGSGIAFDWSVAKEVGTQFPVLVAGGLNPANVQEAIERTGSWGVDVSSGVETEGSKDLAKIAAFVHNARNKGH